MKLKSKHPFMAGALLAAVVGCSRSDQVENRSKPDTSAVTREVTQAYKDLTAVTKEAATATKNYAAEGKDEFVTVMGKKLDELDGRIRELAEKSAGYKDDAKAQADQALAALRDQRSAVGAKFEAVKQAGAETWKDVKAGFDTAVTELEKAYESTKAKFSQPNP